MSATTTAAVAASTGAHPQGGILEGLNPIHYNPKDPIPLFIVQAIIIIVFCRLLHYPLSRFGQPRVIAEVIGGIVLGPSVMMRIPGFKENIFPTESMPVLSNVANLGLLLFLFLVGLEVDTRMFRSNWRVALSVGLASMIIPFGLGVAVAWGLYHEFRAESTLEDMSFGTYALFIGTALAITAFPVLCRILSELQLLGTAVGVTVLAAGIGNDVTGWVLLALSVALVNNASGLTALYVFLTAVAWVLFLVFAVRPAFLWILRRTNSIQNGPSQTITGLTLLMVLVSSWFTAAIGVHAIFGAFLVGLICPKGGFAIKLTEKIEDLVTVLLLPLYFALSGLNTNLGLLNDGKTWGYVVAVIACAFFGKIFGGSVAARMCNCLWRESFTIGALMSCKGLVELIVLNIGLQAGILSQRTFTIFVVMALVTTVTTTPLTRYLYPMWYREKVAKWRRGEIDWDGNPIVTEAQASENRMEEALDKAQTRRITLHLRLDALSGLFNLVALLGDAKKTSSLNTAPKEKEEDGTATTTAPPSVMSMEPSRPASRPLEVNGVRLVELTERFSSFMSAAEDLDEFANRDAVFSAFQTFSRLNGVAVAGQVSVIPTSAYAETISKRAEEAKSDFMLIPWSSHGSLAEDNSSVPFETSSQNDRFFSKSYIDYVQGAIDRTTCTTGIYINRGLEDASGSKRPALSRSPFTGLSVHSAHDGPIMRSPVSQDQRIFVPFIGGRDDRQALLFVLQLAHNPHVSITVAHFSFGDDDQDAQAFQSTDPSTSSGVDKQMAHEPSATDLDLLNTAKKNASKTLEGRVTFTEVIVDSVRNLPDRAVTVARETVGKSRLNVGDLIVTGRNHACFENLLHADFGLEREFQRTVGVLGDRFARAGINAGLLVIKDSESK
ncbi:Sodium/hydrogen exchanger family-domain-containing protein [Dactylonectria estremocensis]|uniref:Sodium/hydrogen exchanger family-domain-containing protein n=1 Tax=Dactylonectria estremocensis TaxID=1079267 RepID=A0A9P9EHI0_9HYPO|nr:Sodium/hydrogen exchanger family-domain-containing protein [Dactylonectria estremocensis]